jgi:hypothetical protein
VRADGRLHSLMAESTLHDDDDDDDDVFCYQKVNERVPA